MSPLTEHEETSLTVLLQSDDHALLRGQLDGEDVALIAIPVPPGGGRASGGRCRRLSGGPGGSLSPIR